MVILWCLYKIKSEILSFFNFLSLIFKKGQETSKQIIEKLHQLSSQNEENHDDISKSHLLSFPCPPSPTKSFFKSLSHLLMIFSILCLVYLIVFYFVFYSDLSSSSSSSNHLKNQNEIVRWLKT